MEIVIDTETTGLTSLSFVTERNYRQWPRLVQIAWGIIVDNKVQNQRTEIIRQKLPGLFDVLANLKAAVTTEQDDPAPQDSV